MRNPRSPFSRCTWFAAVAGGAFCLIPAARGALVLIVTEQGGAPIDIFDNGPFDLNPVVGSINASNTLLNASLVNFAVNSLSASSNRAVGTANDPANIVQTGDIHRSAL